MLIASFICSRLSLTVDLLIGETNNSLSTDYFCSNDIAFLLGWPYKSRKCKAISINSAISATSDWLLMPLEHFSFKPSEETYQHSHGKWGINGHHDFIINANHFYLWKQVLGRMQGDHMGIIKKKKKKVCWSPKNPNLYHYFSKPAKLSLEHKRRHFDES